MNLFSDGIALAFEELVISEKNRHYFPFTELILISWLRITNEPSPSLLLTSIPYGKEKIAENKLVRQDYNDNRNGIDLFLISRQGININLLTENNERTGTVIAIDMNSLRERENQE